MRDRIVWLPKPMDTEEFGKRTVYVKHYSIPFCGIMAAADTAFTVPAYVRIKGKRITGFVTPRDGMAYQQEHGAPWFVMHSSQAEKLS